MSEETEKEPKADEEVTDESPADTTASESVPATEAAKDAAPVEEQEAEAKAAIASEKAEEKEEAPAAEEKKESKASDDSDDDSKDEEASDSSGDSDSDDSDDSNDEARFDKLAKAKEILRESGSSSSSRRGGGSDEGDDNAFEKVIHINRCAKVVKGGRRFSFSALVVSGDGEGHVGFGFGKAKEVIECIKKASEASKKQMVSVNITENTIPHRVIGEHGGGRVLLRPASPGTGLIAGGGVRAVVEAAGIKDVLAKSMGSNNQANVVKATINALEQLRSKEEIYKLRGKKTAEQKSL